MFARQSILAAVVVVIAVGVSDASAQTVQVYPAGTLTDSTSTSTITNDLILNPGPGSTGFVFSGATGSFSSVVSSGGYYYADYLINVTGSTAESVTTSLTNSSGVTNLSERIYSYDSTIGTNGFLGDGKPSTAALQVWSTNYPLPGANVSIVSPTNLVTGSYVVELRGQSAGNFAGTLSVTPIPEPGEYMLMLMGFGLTGFFAARSKKTV